MNFFLNSTKKKSIKIVIKLTLESKKKKVTRVSLCRIWITIGPPCSKRLLRIETKPSELAF